jgi:hypothetical protein
MALPTSRRALTAVVLLGFICVVLLTPLGFETRPTPSIHPLGFVVLLGIFVTVALKALSVLLLRHRPRIATILIPMGTVLVVVGITIDRVGLFSSYAPPGRISVVEAVFVLLELGALLLALRIRSEISAGVSADRQPIAGARTRVGDLPAKLPRSRLLRCVGARFGRCRPSRCP